MEKVIDVAQYIFEKYKIITGEIIDEMKLHKLLYFSQRESFAICGKPMFRENFRGWKYGPVCPRVRYLFTTDGMYCNNIKNISPQNSYIVNNIIEQYGRLTSWDLSSISHKEISWINSRKGIPDGENGDVVMKIEDIEEDAKKVRPYDSVWDMYYDEFDDYPKESES